MDGARAAVDGALVEFTDSEKSNLPRPSTDPDGWSVLCSNADSSIENKDSSLGNEESSLEI